jgi:tetratricopeptide (TPR) repeat protein
MPRIITFIFSIAFAFTAVSAQQTMGFRKADSLTYLLYINGNWKDLAKTGKQALDSGIDYFYMRMRLGIAWYRMGNYAKAEAHFKKALQFNNADQTAAEYLFWTYYLSGRTLQAWSVLYGMPAENAARIKNESRIKSNSLTVESYYSDSHVDQIYSDPERYLNSSTAGTQTVTDYFVNNAVYLSHVLSEKTSYSHAITGLVKNNILHYSDGTDQADLLAQRVLQFQYYGRFNLFTRSGWIISPAFHFITDGYPYPAFTRTGTLYTFHARSNSYAAALGLSKTTGFAVLGSEFVFSKLNEMKQVQASLSAIFYPAGNRNIYFGGTFSGLTGSWVEDPGISLTGSFIAGFSIMRHAWLEVTGTSGSMKNYTENNALIIYNGIDHLTSKINGRLIVPIYKLGLTIYAGAGISNSSSSFIPVAGTAGNRIDFRNYSITGGLSWDF